MSPCFTFFLIKEPITVQLTTPVFPPSLSYIFASDLNILNSDPLDQAFVIIYLFTTWLLYFK